LKGQHSPAKALNWRNPRATFYYIELDINVCRASQDPLQQSRAGFRSAQAACADAVLTLVGTAIEEQHAAKLA
jgi:hypothetical protein